MNGPELMVLSRRTGTAFKAYCNASKRHASDALKAKPSKSEYMIHPDPPVRPLDQCPACARTTRGRRQRIPS